MSNLISPTIIVCPIGLTDPVNLAAAGNYFVNEVVMLVSIPNLTLGATIGLCGINCTIYHGAAFLAANSICAASFGWFTNAGGIISLGLTAIRFRPEIILPLGDTINARINNLSGAAQTMLMYMYGTQL